MSADADSRARLGGMEPGVAFDDPVLVEPPPLAEATVAIVTTAALARPGEPWTPGTHGYRTLHRGDTDLILGHNATSVDRAGFSIDRNVAFPTDRLIEMEAEGEIGRVADRHLSFIGSTPELTTFKLDTGPAAARQLVDDGVDVVLLTPV